MESNKSFWNKYASEFDEIYGTKNSIFNNLINKLFRKCMQLRFEKTIKTIPEENTSVIDIGCGPGHYCFSLAQKGIKEIVGIDFSENMIRLASSHAKELNLQEALQFKVTNFLEFESEKKFDYSIMMGFIEYFENPQKILQKAISLTKQKILVSFPVAGGILAFQRKIRYKKRCYLRLYGYSEIENLLKQLSISKYSIERIHRDFYVTINLS